MPRKSPDELNATVQTPQAPQPAPTAAPQPVQGYHPADLNGDGVIDAEEKAMELEFRRKSLEDQDAMRDAQRSMAWFALFGMLLYPFAVVLAVLLNLDQAADVLGSMAATYFVSVAAIVAAFFGGQAYSQSSSTKKR